MILRRLRHKYIPERLIAETTTRCNAKCVYCGNRDVPKMDMPIELFKRLIDVTPFVKRVDPLSRGEPLLYPHIIEAVQYAKEKKKEVVMHTNGSLLTRELGRDLLRAGLDLLVFSIDECEPGLYGDIRQGLSFHKVLDNVQRFVDMRDGGGYKTEVRVRICLMEENRKRIVKIEQFWKNIVDTVGAMPELDVLSKGEVDAHPFFFNQQPLKCSDPYRSFVVRPDGKVVLCCTDWYDNFMIAKVDMNVTERDVLEIFNSDAMNYLRDGMKTGERIPSVCMFCKGRTGK